MLWLIAFLGRARSEKESDSAAEGAYPADFQSTNLLLSQC